MGFKSVSFAVAKYVVYRVICVLYSPLFSFYLFIFGLYGHTYM